VLAELLFRTLRVRAVFAAGAQRPYEHTDRPYPSAGACYPLEVYLAVDRCGGIDRGLHRYLPDDHALEPVCGFTEGVADLLMDAYHAAGALGRPQILMILAARLARVSWGYGGIAYGLVLKEVGVVMQSVCLAAAAMGIAACPLGLGDARAFAVVAGAGDHGEVSVGEIILGSAPPP
jgi:SagB-type dehydrogenase family enzyme